MDSKDFALLNDALDGRLDASAMEHLRRRIAQSRNEDEPDLAAAWEDLQRIRNALRSMPAPSVPDGFLEGIHAKAGASGASSSSASSSPLAVGGTVSIFRRWAYAAAAVVGLGIGFTAYLASQRPPDAAHNDRANRETAQEKGGEWKSEGDAARRKLEDGVAATEDPLAATAPALATASPPAGGGAAGREASAPPRPPIAFKAPGGAAPPDLRAPSDSPVPPPPPVTRPQKPEGRGGAEEGAFARARATPEKKSDEPARETSLRLDAADFDEARARIALLVASIRRGDAARAGEGWLGALDDEKKSEDPQTADAGGRAKDKADASAAPAEGYALRGALGSFVFTLTPDEARRLTEALSRVSLAKSLASDVGAARSVSVRVVVVKR